MKLFYRAFNLFSRSQAPVVAPIFNDLKEGGRFFCNTARAFSPENYVPRIGEWSSPWETSILPGLEIPDLNSVYNLTFTQVTDLRALEIKKLIDTTDKECFLFYSGGIDSTVVLVSLIKNLDNQSLKKVTLSMSSDSIIENPYFFKKYIDKKFNIIDSNINLYTDILNNTNSFCISADVGDFIYGTEIGVKLYPYIRKLKEQLPASEQPKYDELYYRVSDKNTHYSEYKNLLILFFNSRLLNSINMFKSMPHLPEVFTTFKDEDRLFGELFYNKIERNIKSCYAPVQSLHDFFWWTMFNPRFLWGVIRPGLTYGLENNLKDIVQNSLISWYAGKEYQLWSLNNNNNGEKLHGTTQSTYKWASRNYIWEFDKNDWYRDNKIKMPSMPILLRSNWKKHFNELDNRFGLRDNYDIIKVGDPNTDNFIREGISNFTIDWC